MEDRNSPNMFRSFFGRFNRRCELSETIDELSSKPDIDNFHRLKQLVASAHKYTLEDLFIAASRKGILRDVEYMAPIVIGNDLKNAINKAFCAAAENCHIAVMDLLITNGADCCYDNNLPIKQAVIGGNVESVKYLLEIGADIHTDDDQLLFLCCQNGDYADVADLLIKKGVDVLKHYHKTLNCCFNLKRNDCASILIRYSDNSLKKPTMQAAPMQQYNQDEMDALMENRSDEELEEDCVNDDNNSDVSSDASSNGSSEKQPDEQLTEKKPSEQ